MAKILLVEDSNTDLTFLQKTLQVLPHELITAKDGEDAEAKVAAQKVDLIVLDVIMPKKNGFQVCRTLKKDPRFQHIPIIITTSKTAESDKFWGERQGADEYLTKPLAPAELLATVKKYLK
ncbi:response regulator transcription factor [Geoalkalibacter sp.]|uniref:response regulator transcription factor n=1 Tax=Geoalkalibacter sp. TaxID=3041440 RepID=UPI00272E8494|nr:response regulator [Geoalkalibacter sp.]